MILFLQKHGFDKYLFLVRIWFASLLLYHGFTMSEKDIVYIVCHWVLGKSVLPPEIISYLAIGIEWVCAVSLVMGLFTRFFSAIIGSIMLFAIVLFFVFHTIDLNGGTLALTRYFFWFSVIIIFFGPGAWSADQSAKV
jgi:uncharacterized membrane protein YphA (DoxX/SURF4 family)